MNNLPRWAAATIALTLSSAALATEPDSAGPRWFCWYASETLTVACQMHRSPQSGNDERAAEVARTTDGRLPALVQVIWGRAEELAAERVSIPLRNVPYDMKVVGELASSVMCGRRNDCTVLFDANRDQQATVRAAALLAGAGEAEVMAEVNRQETAILLAAATVSSEYTDNTPRRRRNRR